jgi:hypothetical protein
MTLLSMVSNEHYSRWICNYCVFLEPHSSHRTLQSFLSRVQTTDGWDDYDDEYKGSVSMSYGDTEGSNNDPYATVVDDNYDDYQGSVSMSYGDSSDDQYATFVNDDDDIDGSISTSMSMSQSSYYDDGIVDDDMMPYIATEPTTA